MACAQPVNLPCVFLELFLGDVDGDVKLGGLRAQLGLLFEHVERVGASGGFLQHVVCQQDLGNFAVCIGALGLVQGRQLRGCVAFGDQPGSEIFVDVGLDFLELREDRLRLRRCRLASVYRARELLARWRGCGRRSRAMAS